MTEKKYEDVNSLIYVLFLGPFCIALFLYGFFPMVQHDSVIATRNDIPQFIEMTRLKTDVLYKPLVKRLIVMVIDALRWDFVAGPKGKAAMPVTSGLISNSSACLFKAKVQTPTVTMPRIKAITTGTVPGFIDVALNLGSKPVATDNLLFQAKQHGYKLVFYGDETWLTLFPNIFEQYDGTTSFFVTDFTEVDNNVTRHIDHKLHSNDWSIMILHYLGLDHIGHVHGPFSPIIETKLKEMDDIINKIQSQIQYWNNNGIGSLFVICGDHGMKDSGSHGGSTIPETTVPFIAIGAKCLQKNSRPTKIAQVDITSTLSAILGVPIPSTNVGSVFVEKLYELPVSQRLFLLHYNVKQVLKRFQKLPNYYTEYAYKRYSDAVKLHAAWLNTKSPSNDMIDDIALSYHTALKGMKETLINSMVKYDLPIMTVAIFFLFHTFCIAIGIRDQVSVTLKKFIFLLIPNIVLWIIVNCILESDNSSVLYSGNQNSICLLLCVISILCINCYLLAKFSCLDVFVKMSKIGEKQWIFSFGLLIHALSLGASSFVEEEHQTWYFFWLTALMFLSYDYSKRLISHWTYFRSYERHSRVNICIKLLLLLIGHRILRKLNSTGDKYAHLPDISGWLKEGEDNIGITLILVAALTLLIWVDFISERHGRKRLIFSSAMAVCIYLRHMANNVVARIPLYPASSGIYEAQVFWILLAIFLLYNIFRLILVFHSKVYFIKHSVLLIIRMWVMISAMLQQPYNVILLPMQIIFSSIIYTVLKANNNEKLSMFFFLWTGNVFYFYQGNSNSLATIDIAAGYVGLKSYMPFVIGTLLLINTYSAPVLAYFMLVHYTTLEQPYQTYRDIIKVSRVYILWRFLPMIMYTIIITIQRHHLFVWTVFSPKLLYEAVHSAIMCFTVLLVLSTGGLQYLILNK